MSVRRLAAACASAALILASASPASAQSVAPAAPVDEARTHFDRGLTLLETQNFEGALTEFERSYELGHRPSVLYNIAVTLQALHRYPEGIRYLERYLTESAQLSPDRRAEVQRVIGTLRGLIAHVRVSVARSAGTIRVDGNPAGDAVTGMTVDLGPGPHAIEWFIDGVVVAHEQVSVASGDTRDVSLVEAPSAPAAAAIERVTECSLMVRGAPAEANVEVDGHAFPVARQVELPPGPHEVTVRAPGQSPWHGTVNITAGEGRIVTIRMTRTRGLPLRWFAIGAGATVVFGLTALVTGILTLGTHDEFSMLYQGDPQLRDVAARGDAERNATNAMLVLSGIALAGTVVLATQTRFGPSAPTADISLAPLPGGAMAAVGGRF